MGWFLSTNCLPARVLPSSRIVAPTAPVCKHQDSAFSEKFAPFPQVEMM